jgi:hypothetical protein
MLERVMAVAAVGLVGVLLSACTGPAQKRRPVELVEDAVLVVPAELEVGVQSCNGNPEITQLTETDQQVRVEVTATVFDPGDSCMDLIVVALDAPLGDRELVDLTSGRTIRVVPRPGS